MSVTYVANGYTFEFDFVECGKFVAKRLLKLLEGFFGKSEFTEKMFAYIKKLYHKYEYQITNMIGDYIRLFFERVAFVLARALERLAFKVLF